MQETALNGAQVSSLVDIVSRVALGQIPRESGVRLVTASFPLSTEQAEQILGSAGTPQFQPTTPSAPAAPTLPQSNPDEELDTPEDAPPTIE